MQEVWKKKSLFSAEEVQRFYLRKQFRESGKKWREIQTRVHIRDIPCQGSERGFVGNTYRTGDPRSWSVNSIIFYFYRLCMENSLWFWKYQNIAINVEINVVLFHYYVIYHMRTRERAKHESVL